MMLRPREPEIRLASPADGDSLLSALRERHAEGGVGTFDEMKVKRMLLLLLSRQTGIVLAVRGRQEIEGSLGLVLTDPWDASEFYLRGLWLFVSPAYRKSTHAKRLIEAAKTYADGLERRLSLEEVATPDTERKLALYRRQMPERGHLFEYLPAALSTPATAAAP